MKWLKLPSDSFTTTTQLLWIIAFLSITEAMPAQCYPPSSLKEAMAPANVLDVAIQNDYIEIAVEDSIPTAQFTLGNIEGDPANPNDDNQILLYGHPNPWSSFTTVRIDGTDAVFGGNAGTFTEVPTAYPSYIKTVWTRNNIQITQVTGLSRNPSTDRIDAMQIRYMIENIDTQNHTVGLRVLLDTMLGANDGAPFQVPGTGAVLTETEYTGASVPDYWQSFDSLDNPTVISQQTLRGGLATPPDRLVLVSWPDFYNSNWNYTVTPGKIFGTTEYPDSAVGLYWNPVALPAGNRIEYVTYYGLSGLSQSMLPPVTLSVGAPLSLDIVNNAYSPNPFTVVAYLENISTNPVQNIDVAIQLPQGLTLNGSPATQNISLNAGESASVNWSVQAATQAAETLLAYDVTADWPLANQRSVTRSVLLPALLLVYDTNFRSNPDGYQFNNFVVADINSWVFFRNTFGADETEINGNPRPMALNFYSFNFRYYAAGGSCLGMSSSSSILRQNSHEAWDLGTNRNVSLNDVGEPYVDWNNNGRYDWGDPFVDSNGNGVWDSARTWSIIPGFLQTPRDWIEYYQLRWASEAIQENRQTQTPNDVYARLKQRMAEGDWDLDPMVLVFWWPVNRGHAVVPYRIEEAANNQSAAVRIYDNNFANQQRTVNFDLLNNTVSDPDYNGGNNLSSIEVIDLSAIQSEPQMANYDNVTPSANLLYTDSEGNLLGFVDGVLVSEIEGAYKLEIPWLNENPEGMPGTYYTGKLNLKRELIGKGAGMASVSIAKPGSLAVVELEVAEGSVDEIKVPPDGSSVEVIPGDDLDSLSLTLDKETQELARQFHVHGIAMEAGSSISQAFSEDLSSAVLINRGGKKSFHLWMEEIGINPGKYTHPELLEVEANSSIWLTPRDWEDLDKTYIQVDHDWGNDGTIDETEVISELAVLLDIDPDTLQLKSNGVPITAYLQFGEGPDVLDIDVNSIEILTIQGQGVDPGIGITGPHNIGDSNGDGIRDLMVKFDREAVSSRLREGTAEIGIVGQLLDGTFFSGSDTITVLEMPEKK